MKRIVTRTLVAAGALTLLIGTAACRHHGCDRPNPERMKQIVDWKVDDVLDDLDASDSQRQVFTGIKDRLFAQGQAMRAERKGDRDVVLAELAKAEPDVAKLHTLIDEHAARMTAFAHAALDELAVGHKTLSPEQRAAIVAKMRECHGED